MWVQPLPTVCAPNLTSLLQEMMAAINSFCQRTNAPQKHVMFSYSWSPEAKPDHVRSIASKLPALCGVEAWTDVTGSSFVGKMAGSTDEIMAAAVEASSHFVVCVSREYKNSANCRQEATYARQFEKKGKLKMIYVMMQSDFTSVSQPDSVDGWLGAMLGNSLWCVPVICLITPDFYRLTRVCRYAAWNPDELDDICAKISDRIKAGDLASPAFQISIPPANPIILPAAMSPSAPPLDASVGSVAAAATTYQQQQYPPHYWMPLPPGWIRCFDVQGDCMCASICS